MISLWQREQRVVDLWLMLVMWIWLFDIALAAVIGSTRFDLGFYAGRLFGLLAASFLLLTLLGETFQMYQEPFAPRRAPSRSWRSSRVLLIVPGQALCPAKALTCSSVAEYSALSVPA